MPNCLLLQLLKNFVICSQHPLYACIGFAHMNCALKQTLGNQAYNINHIIMATHVCLLECSAFQKVHLI